jgi:hypothetical protein
VSGLKFLAVNFRLLVFAVGSMIGSMVTAVAGTAELLFIVRLYKNPKRSSDSPDY